MEAKITAPANIPHKCLVRAAKGRIEVVRRTRAPFVFGKVVFADLRRALEQGNGGIGEGIGLEPISGVFKASFARTVNASARAGARWALEPLPPASDHSLS